MPVGGRLGDQLAVHRDRDAYRDHLRRLADPAARVIRSHRGQVLEKLAGVAQFQIVAHRIVGDRRGDRIAENSLVIIEPVPRIVGRTHRGDGDRLALVVGDHCRLRPLSRTWPRGCDRCRARLSLRVCVLRECHPGIARSTSSASCRLGIDHPSRRAGKPNRRKKTSQSAGRTAPGEVAGIASQIDGDGAIPPRFSRHLKNKITAPRFNPPPSQAGPDLANLKT